MLATMVASTSHQPSLPGLPRGRISSATATATAVQASSSTSAAEAAAAAEFAAKKFVWIPDRDLGYRSAWVVREEKRGEETVVAFDDGTQKAVSSGDLSRQNPPRFELSENIADLTFLSEAGVSHCLRQRYQRGLIYVSPLCTVFPNVRPSSSPAPNSPAFLALPSDILRTLPRRSKPLPSAAHLHRRSRSRLQGT